ncbi:hypothetical protein DIPPA_08302 [Diplonema papillatum]|nr:hypothetical protein DIPPA_08302 [Diplonema papillatum]
MAYQRAAVRSLAELTGVVGAQQCHGSIARAMNEGNFEEIRKKFAAGVSFSRQTEGGRPTRVAGAPRVLESIIDDQKRLEQQGVVPVYSFADVYAASVQSTEGSVTLHSQLLTFHRPSGGLQGGLVESAFVDDQFQLDPHTSSWLLASRSVRYNHVDPNQGEASRDPMFSKTA